MTPLFRAAPLRPLLHLELLLLGGLLWVGCEGRGTPPDVPSGQFTAYVTGAVEDTLRGTAHSRRADGALTGLELGARDGPGLSIELEPQSPELRTYEVLESELFRLERPNGTPAVLAFLSLEHAEFEATGGTLELTYVSEDQVGATFTFQMEGRFDDSGGDDASIEVTGAVNAPSGG